MRECYKIAILTLWLGFSGYILHSVYTRPAVLGCSEWGNIISVLGVIVATLIGWQIYSSIDWVSKSERISKLENLAEDLQNSFIKDQHRNRADISFVQALMMHNDTDKMQDKLRDNYPNVYRLYLESLSNYLSSEHSLTVESCLFNMETIIQYMETFKPNELPPNFMDDCNNLYLNILRYRKKLTSEQIERLNKLNEKRKTLFPENTKAASYWRNVLNALFNKTSS